MTEPPGPEGLADDAVRARLEIDAKEIIGRYPQARSALLPMLHLVQAEEGFVSAAGIEFCADMLELTSAEVAAVATFYTMYRRRPGGTYAVGVCTNTLCAVLGGDEIFSTLKEHLGIGHDETTEDGAITLEHLECNAACDYAPVMMVNWEFFDNQTPQSAISLVDDLRAGNEVRPTRGPRLCTFAEVSRVLAGFPDGLANDGPSAGPASLIGLQVARERGDVAPESEADAKRREASTPAPAQPQAPAAEAPTKAAAKPVTKKATAKKATAKKATAKKATSKRSSVPPVSLGEASAPIRTGGGGTSAHDAGVSTAQSDEAHDAEPGEDHE